MQLFSRLVLLALIVTLSACNNTPAPVKKPVAKVHKKTPIVKPIVEPVSEPEPSTQTQPEEPEEVVKAGVEQPIEKSEMAEEKRIVPKGTPVLDAKPLELVKKEVKLDFDGVQYVLFAPADAKIRPDQDKFRITAGPRFNMEIELGHHDLGHIAGSTGKLENVEIVSQSPDTLVLKAQTIDFKDLTRRVESHQFYANRSFGYRDFAFSAIELSEESGQCFYSKTDQQTMLKAAEQFALAVPLPEDPVEILKLMEVTLHKNDKDEIYWAILPAIGTTDSTLPLLAKIPSIVELKAESLDAKESSWKILNQLPKLERLSIGDNELGEEGAAIVSGLKQLKELGIGDWKMPMSRIKQLEKLEALESLSIASNEITDASMEQFPLLPNLKSLSLSGRRVPDNVFTGTGFAHLAKLTKLQSLNITQEGITDEGLKGIAKLTTLKELHAQECKNLTNAGIANLAPLKELEKLVLSYVKIDDAAVDALCAMKTLKTLSIDSTKITDAGHEKLKTALPDCKIYYK